MSSIKAQLTLLLPQSPEDKENRVIEEFLHALGPQDDAVDQDPELAVSEQVEHCAFQGLHDAIAALEVIHKALEDHEKLEKDKGVANKGDKIEEKAITKLGKVLDTLRDIEKQLHEGEKVEHEEKQDKQSEVVIEIEEEGEIPDLK